MRVNSINEVMQSLQQSHINEIAIDEISVNEELYRDCYKYAFIKDGRQIGYIAYVILRHSHYEKMVLQEICYFIEEKSRAFARTIFRLIENKAKQQGCDWVLLGCKNDKQERFFSAIGYKPSDRIMKKELK